MTLMRNEGTNHLAGMNILNVIFFFLKTGSQKIQKKQIEFEGVIESETHGHTDIN